MAKIDEFAHGHHYGDYSGLVFYGPPKNGLWLDRLAISDRYIEPLFRGVLDRTWRESGGERVPRLASDSNTLVGWVAGDGPVPITPADWAEFADALAQLGPSDLAGHCAGCTPEECLRCAAIVGEHISTRLAPGAGLYIEDD